MLTCANELLFYEVFEGQVHQVPYLCMEEAQRAWVTFPAMTTVLFHICVRTYMLKAYFEGGCGFLEIPKDSKK